jgi:OmpA-OmpF porin, OOP family
MPRPVVVHAGRAALLLAAAALGGAVSVLPIPAAAQSDPAAQALIERLRPSAVGPSRGIRIPGESPPHR